MSQQLSKYWGVIPAAGIGSRMAADVPKQYLLLDGQPVISYSVQLMRKLADMQEIVVALRDQDPYWPTLHFPGKKEVSAVVGGEQRADSVFAALQSLRDKAADQDWVLVHDSVRPCCSTEDVNKLITRLNDHPVGGLLAVPVSDTIKEAREGEVVRTVPRECLYRALTPQMFRFGLLYKALVNASEQGLTVTDEASAIEYLGEQPTIVEGSSSNIKITWSEDLGLASSLLKKSALERLACA